MSEEEKNIEIRRLLKSLPDVKAGSDFEQRLKEKISLLELQEESEKRKSENKTAGLLDKIFGSKKNPWLVPALGFSIVVLFTVYVTYTYRQSTLDNFKDSSQEKNMMKQEAADTVKNNSDTQTELQAAPESEMNKTLKTNIPPVDANKSVPETDRKSVQITKPETAETEFRKEEPGTQMEDEDDKNLIKEEIIPQSADEDAEMKKSENVPVPTLMREENTGTENATDKMMMKKDSSDSLKKLDSLNKIKLEILRDKLNENK